MPKERRQRVPGSSTDKGKIFTFSTKHPDQYIQWVWGGGGIFLQGKCLGHEAGYSANFAELIFRMSGAIGPFTFVSCRCARGRLFLYPTFLYFM